MLKCRQYEDLRKQLGVREEDSIEKVLFGGGEEYLLRLEERMRARTSWTGGRLIRSKLECRIEVYTPTPKYTKVSKYL